MFQSVKERFEKINSALGLISGGAMFCAGLILFAEVVCRYSGNPTNWIPETSVYLFAGAMLMGAPYTLMREKHIRVELVTSRFSPRIQDICRLCTSLAGMAFCMLIAHYGWLNLMDVVATGETTATTLRIPLWITEMPVFIGFSLLAVQFFIQACDRTARLRRERR